MKRIKVTLLLSALALLGGCMAVPVAPDPYAGPYYAPAPAFYTPYYAPPVYVGPSFGFGYWGRSRGHGHWRR